MNPLPPQIESRIAEYAKYLKWTREQVITAAIMRFSGMEGMPLEDEEVYGKMLLLQKTSGETLPDTAQTAGNPDVQGSGLGVRRV